MIESLLNFLLRFPEWFQMSVISLVTIGVLFLLCSAAFRGIKYGKFEIPGRRAKTATTTTRKKKK